jgi:hypothetical protein
MKARALTLLTGFIFISFFSNSQSRVYNAEVSKPTKSKEVTKGYYSIYNNIEKLPSGSLQLSYGQKKKVREAGKNIFPKLQKGYYAIGNNHTANGIDLPDTTPFSKGKRVYPVVTKGYYSIGSNVEKLRK